MIQNRRLALNIVANSLQILVSIGLIFTLYRYINERLGAAAFGVWAVVLAVTSASRLADLGLSASVTRFVARHLARGDAQAAAQVIETAILSVMSLFALALPFLYWPLWTIFSYLFDVDRLVEARVVLPYALVSLWLTVTATVCQSGLDGCQRMDLRASLIIFGQILMVALAFLLIPGRGLVGLAWAQIGQGIFLIFAGWWLLKGRLRALHWVPSRWSGSHFKEMFYYGVNVQTATLFMLLFDPLTKALLARFGGPESAGYFEMANQVVLKARALIVTANQAIVPRVVQIKETTPEQLPFFYHQNMRVLIFVGLPVFSLLYACSGFFSWMLVGYIDAKLQFFIRVNTVAWFFNLLAVPAYFANLGTGLVGWNTLTHVSMGLLNGVLGWYLGQRFGFYGVTFSYAVALAIGSCLLVVLFQKRSGARIPIKEHGWLAAMSVLITSFSHFIWGVNPEENLIFIATIIFIFVGLIFSLWRHPLRGELWMNLSHYRHSRYP